MPLRVRFVGVDPPPEQDEIARALLPLVNAGWAVTVAHPEERTDYMGWRVLLDKPGSHTSFRVPIGATVAVWRACIERRAPPSN